MLSFKQFENANKRDDQEQNNITHFFSRHFVNYFAFPLYKIGLTPNQTTIIFILIGIVGGVLSFFNYLLFAYVLWRVHIIIDMADGSIARATKLFSDYGDTLDKAGHHIIYPIYWLGFLYACGLIYDQPLLSIIFFAIASSQWTIKHLFKNRNERPQAKNIFKRIFANMFGIEGFLVVILIYSYLDYFDSMQIIIFLILTNSFLLIRKIYSLLNYVEEKI